MSPRTSDGITVTNEGTIAVEGTAIVYGTLVNHRGISGVIRVVHQSVSVVGNEGCIDLENPFPEVRDFRTSELSVLFPRCGDTSLNRHRFTWGR